MKSENHCGSTHSKGSETCLLAVLHRRSQEAFGGQFPWAEKLWTVLPSLWMKQNRQKRLSKQLTRFVQMSFNTAPQGAKFLCHSVADLSVYSITECLHPRCEGKQLHRPGDQTGHSTNIIPAPCCSLNWPSIPNCLFTFILICVGLPTGFPVSSFAPYRRGLFSGLHAV